MTGERVREARRRLGLTQQQAAKRWRLSQAYLSLAEAGKRPVPNRLARLLVRTEPRLATGLPLEVPDAGPDELTRLLGGLGYPGFAYLADPRAMANPATVVLATLQIRGVPTRVTEALPWVLLTFPDLDWDWLLDQAKRSNLQNRLGYLVHLARKVAEPRGGGLPTAQGLAEVERRLEDARLVKEDTLGRDLTEVERRHLREHRPSAARHWNLLTNLRAEDLRYDA